MSSRPKVLPEGVLPRRKAPGVVVDRQVRFAESLVELADNLDPGFGESEYVDRVTAELADLLAPAELGLQLVDAAGQGGLGTASTARVGELLALDQRLGEGPWTSCGDGERLIRAADLAGWPRFAPAARAHGFRTVTALPLGRRDVVVGAVAVFGTDGGLTDDALAAARVLTRIAAIAVLQHRALAASTHTASNLQRALDERVLVEQAKGVVAARLGLTPDAAFDVLRRYARAHQLPLKAVAVGAIHGQLPG